MAGTSPPSEPVTWLDPVSGDWDTGSNWSSGQAPGAGEDVSISAAPGGLYAVTVTTPVNVNSLAIKNTTLSLDDTSFSAADDVTLSGVGGFANVGVGSGGEFNVSGTLTMSGLSQLNVSDGFASLGALIDSGSTGDMGGVSLAGYTPSQGNGPTSAILQIAGAAGDGVAGVLNGQILLQGDSLVEFASGNIQTISGSGSLDIRSPDAFVAIQGSTTSNSAFDALSNNAGSITLYDGAEISTDDSLTNSGGIGLDGDGGYSGGSKFQVVGTLTNSGVIGIGNEDDADHLSAGDAVSAGALVNSNQIYLYGSGDYSAVLDVAGAIENDGVIDAGSITGDPGRSIIYASQMTGTGGISIGDDATLELNVRGATSQTVNFAGSSSTLVLDYPTDFAGTLAGLQTDDTIDLVGLRVAGAAVSGDALTVTEADGATLQYNLSGFPSGDDFALLTDGHGGTDLVVEPVSRTYDFADFEVLGTKFEAKMSVNDHGQLVGQSVDDNYVSQSVLSSDGATTPLADPSAPDAAHAAQYADGIGTVATGINNDGVVAGYYYDSAGQDQAFTESAGVYTDLPASGKELRPQAINDSGEVAGYVVGGEYQGFTETNGVVTTFAGPAGSVNTVFEGINDSGEIVGYYEDEGGPAEGLVDIDGTFTTVNDPLGTNGTVLTGINNAGEIVGYYTGGANTGYLAQGFVDIGGVFTTVDDPSSYGDTVITGVNDAGEVAGWYANQQDQFVGFTATPQSTTTVSWLNGAGGDWDVGSNWSTGAAPGAGDDVSIAAGGATYYVVSVTAPVDVNSISVTNPNALLAIGDTTVDVAGDVSFDGDGGAGDGGLTVKGGGQFQVGGTLSLGAFASLALSAGASASVGALDDTGSAGAIGSVSVSGSTAGQGNAAPTTLQIAAAAGDGVAGELNGGLDVSDDALVEFTSGGIQSISSSGTLELTSANAFVADRGATTSNSALDQLSDNAGLVLLTGEADISTAASFTNSGNLQLYSGSAFSTAGAFTNSGNVYLDSAGGYGGGSQLSVTGTLTNSHDLDIGDENDASGLMADDVVTAGALVNEAGGQIQLYGDGDYRAILDISGTLENDGVIDAGSITGDPGRSVVDANEVTGTGSFSIGDDATLELNVSGTTSQTVNFAGSSSTLVLDDPKEFTGTLAGLQTGDTIDLAGVNAAGAFVLDDVLIVNEAGNSTLQYNLSGFQTGDVFALTSDGQGGTDLTVQSAPALNYAFADFGAPGAGFEARMSINDQGQLVGQSLDDNSVSVSVLDSGGTTTAIADPSAPDASHAAQYKDGIGTVATGINNNGEIVGYYYDSSGNDQAFTESNGVYTDLETSGKTLRPEAINDSGEVVGYAVGGEYEGFTETNGVVTTFDGPAGSVNTVFNGINDAGEIVGFYEALGGPTQGLVDIDGVFTTVDDPLGINGTVLTGISNNGEIAGYYVGATDTGYETHGFVDINGAFTTVDDPNVTNTEPGGVEITGVNDAGEIVGSYSEGNPVDASREGFTATPEVACYLRGTRILTERGEVAIEALAIGDRVVTASGPARPVVWLGHRALDCGAYADPKAVWPVRVSAGAFAPGVPSRDLWLSPAHNIAFEGALVPALHLQNGQSVAQVPVKTVEYRHLELDAHDIVLAEGLPAESYLDTGNRTAFVNGGAFIEAHPDFAPRHWAETCLPLVLEGPEVVHAKAALLRRLGDLGHAVTGEADAHVVADGRRIDPIPLGPARIAFVLPEKCSAIRLKSRVFVPAHTLAGSSDPRLLGLCVSRLQLDGVDVDFARDPGMSEGWHDREPGHCWTRGDTPLPPNTRLAVIELGGPGHYWSCGERAGKLRLA
jgi:probable HAF family extracellular repeat protein